MGTEGTEGRRRAGAGKRGGGRGGSGKGSALMMMEASCRVVWHTSEAVVDFPLYGDVSVIKAPR